MLLPPMPIQRLSGRIVSIEDVSLEDRGTAEGALDDILATVRRLHAAGVRRLSVAPLEAQTRGRFTWRDWSDRPKGLRIAMPVHTPSTAADVIAASPDIVLLRNLAADRERSMGQMIEVMAMIPAGIGISVAIESAFDTDAHGAENELAVDIGDFFAANGASEVILCDTDGTAGPLRIEQGCDGLAQRWVGKHVGVELSDSHGMASANVIAAMSTGIGHFRLVNAREAGDARRSYMALARMLGAMECHC